MGRAFIYSYGNALWIRLHTSDWSSPDFDLDNSYGASREGQNARPAYLFLARDFLYGLKALG